MNIAIISAVYPPETFASARLGFDLATFLTERDCRVTVLCPQPSRPENADFSHYRNHSSPVIAWEDGIEVVRLPSFAAPQSKIPARIRESYSFGRHACRYLTQLEQQPDVLYVNAWPLLSQALIMRYAKSRDIPVVLQIMDIYPESLLNKSRSLFRHLAALPLRKLDQWIARQASEVVVISENMRNVYINSRSISADKVTIIHLWQDESLFELPQDRTAACSQYNVPDNRFTFLYLGNIGPVAGVDLLIRAFHAASLESAQLLLIGDGSEKTACMQLVEQLGVSRVYFFSCLDVTLVPLMQSMADVCLLPVKRGAALSSIPSKLPAYLFSAKPVLATVDADSDTARLIHQAQCGWIGPPEDLEWLAEKMSIVAAMPGDYLAAFGEKGKAFGREHYSKSLGVKRLADIIISCEAAQQQKDFSS